MPGIRGPSKVFRRAYRASANLDRLQDDPQGVTVEYMTTEPDPHQTAELAWCAGFFDSEGIALRYLQRLILQVRHPVPDPLYRIRRSLNGHVRGPYFDIKDHGPEGVEAEQYWIWQCSGETAHAAALVLVPLSTCKREALQKLL
jgi:hypothetical protein